MKPGMKLKEHKTPVALIESVHLPTHTSRNHKISHSQNSFIFRELLDEQHPRKHYTTEKFPFNVIYPGPLRCYTEVVWNEHKNRQLGGGRGEGVGRRRLIILGNLESSILFLPTFGYHLKKRNFQQDNLVAKAWLWPMLL